MPTRRLFLTSALSAAFASAKEPRWLVGANTAIQGYGLYDAIDLLRKLEFPVIEIHPMGRPEPTPKVYPGFEFNKLTAAERMKLRTALKPFRMVTAHLPYTGLNWLSPDPALRQHAVSTVDTALEGAAFFGATLAVLHPQPLPATDSWRSHHGEYRAAIRRWADRARQLGIRIALETGHPASIADYLEFVQGIDHSHVGATIDVGHQSRYKELVARVRPEDRAKPESIRAYNETTFEIVKRLGPKVFHFHVHDIEPATWAEHKPMIHGFVDYPRLFELLATIDYKGVLLLEIGGDPARMPEYLEQARDTFRRWLT